MRSETETAQTLREEVWDQRDVQHQRASGEVDTDGPKAVPPAPRYDVSKVQRVLEEDTTAASVTGDGDDVSAPVESDAVHEATIPIPTALVPTLNVSSSSSSSPSSKKARGKYKGTGTKVSATASLAGKRPRQTKRDRLKNRKEALKRAKEASPDGDVGWIRALFNQIDTDEDGHITVTEMRAFAEKLNLPRNFMHEFELYAVGHPDAGLGSAVVNPDGLGPHLVPGTTKVDFDAFLMALHHRDHMLMRACTQGAGNSGSTLFDEVQERGVWLVCLLVLQSVSGMVLQRYEAMLSRHVIITVFLTMLVGAGGNAGNQSAIKMIEGIAIGEIALDFSAFMTNMVRELSVGLLLAVVVGVGGFIRAYATHGFRHGHEGLQNVMAMTICLAAIVLVAALVGTALPFALGALDMDPAHAGTVVQVVMDIIGVIVTCGVCQVALRDQNGNNSGRLAKMLSWLAQNVVGCGGDGADGDGSGAIGMSPKRAKGMNRGERDSGAPIL